MKSAAKPCPAASFQERVGARAILDRPADLSPLLRLIGHMKSRDAFAAYTGLVAWSGSLAPSNGHVLYIRSLWAGRERRIGDALDLMRRAVGARPYDLSFRLTFSRMLASIGHTAESVDQLLRAAALPGCPTATINEALGWLRAAGQVEKYRWLLRRLAVRSPHRADVMALWGAKEMDHGGAAAGRRMLRRSLVLDPESPNALHWLCREALIQDEDVARTRQLLDHAEAAGQLPSVTGFYRACIEHGETGLTDALVDRFRTVCRSFDLMPGGRSLVRTDEIAGAMADHRPSAAVEPAGSSPVLLVSADAGYFNTYAEALVASAATLGLFAAAHFHIVGAMPDADRIDRVQRQGLDVHFSSEAGDGPGFKSRCALARFTAAAGLLRTYRRDILITDLDFVLAPGIGPMLRRARAGDGAFTIRFRHVPWHAVWAGCSLLRYTARGLDLAHIVAATARLAFEACPDWLADQASLISALRYVARFRPDLTVHNLAEDPDLDAAWTTISGSAKAQRIKLGALPGVSRA